MNRPTLHVDTRALLQANDAFYRAFESYDIARMDKLWIQAPRATCIHPSWQLLRGWPAIRQSFIKIFTEPEKLRFTLSNVGVQVKGDLAWVTLVENLSSSDQARRIRASTMLATNVFERGDDGVWRIVHHHASVMPAVNPG